MTEPENLREKAEERRLKVRENAGRLADNLKADVLLYNGDFDPVNAPDEMLLDMCAGRSKRDNVLLVLITNGGDADTAYRVARCLQRAYEGFYALVPGWCKSAGTLVVMGADEIIMTEHGQLGPLDVQLNKPDELFESTSGLDTIQAMNFLKSRAFSQFEDTFLDLKYKYGNRLSTKTATEIATNLTTGLFQPVYQQIEPNRLGEIARAMSIAQEYGLRLDKVSNNLRETREHSALQKLVNGYPSHRFVIDREEAQELFKRVREPTDDEQAFVDSLEDYMDGISRVPNIYASAAEAYPEPYVAFLTTGIKEGGKDGEEQASGEDTEGEREETGPAARGAGQDFAGQLTPDGKAGQEQAQPLSS